MQSSSSRFDIKPASKILGDQARAELMSNLGFGRLFTEHMVVIPFRDGEWGRGVLQPYRSLQLDPAASILHYGQAIFEGFKAYRQPNGGVSTFRPDANAERFNGSARRLSMPELPKDLFIEAADVLIRQDRHWVPSARGQSLYIRPLMIATEAALGVRPAKEYLFLVFGSPSGDYFPKGVKPVTVWISDEYVRAAPGGTGAAKCAGNYAASLIVQKEAADQGCDQVVWLDAVTRSAVEEMGGMNLFFVYQDGGKTTLATPALTGSLLAGITRDSILKLGKDFGFEVAERQITVNEWRSAIAEGRMTEVFACGTAAVITPVAQVKGKRGEFTINGGEPGPVAMRLREALLDVQYGAAPDRHNWMHQVC